MPWRHPITNRTQKDIDEKQEQSIAYLNVSDLERIEGNIVYLANALNGYLYYIKVKTRINWNQNDIPTTADIKRICENITKIKDAFCRPVGYKDIPELENKPLHFDDVNLIEKNLLLLREALDCMENGFKEANTFQSNTTLFLPKRRN